MKRLLIGLMSTTALGTTMVRMVPAAERRYGIFDQWDADHQRSLS